MEPTEALRSIETRLRLILNERMGPNWVSGLPDGQRRRLETWRTNEVVKRGAHVEHDDLADYTMTGELARLITDNWKKFEQVFRDQDEFNWLMRNVESVRNTIAHSRALLPYERDLLSGAAGKINQLVATYRADAGDSDSYFPRIERLTDNMGTQWIGDPMSTIGRYTRKRLDVGTVLTIQCSSTPIRGKALRWDLRRFFGPFSPGIPSSDPVATLHADSGELRYEITGADVSETFGLNVSLRTDSPYARHTDFSGRGSHDDHRQMLCSVNPDD